MPEHSRSPQPLWYKQAQIYDLAFAWDPKPEVEFLRAVFEREHVSCGGLIFEAFMGSGRLWPGLMSHGYRCAGFDSSKSMVQNARQRFANTPTHNRPIVWQGNAGLCALQQQRFDAAHCLIDSFRYLRTMGEARRFMDEVAQSLKPNAPFVLGLELHQEGPPAKENWSTEVDGRKVRTSIFSHGNAGPGLQWMDVEVVVEGQDQDQTFQSRGIQRVWTPRAFLDFIDALTYFDVASMHPRTHEAQQVIQSLPARGGPIIVVFVRNSSTA